MKKTSGEKGITLVALIITIIVLLILATVAIAAIKGDGIISKAKEAQISYNDAQDKEQIQLALNEWKMVENTNPSKTFVEFMKEKFGEDKVTKVSEDEVIVTMESGNKYRVKADGTIISTKGVSINKSSLTLELQEGTTLTASLSEITGEITWSNGDNAIATISATKGENITVTAVAKGSTTITATCGSYKATCTVTVTGPIEIGSYVEYDVPYTDMYSGIEYTKTNGWRYLGKDDSGNQLIVSTGIPAILYYSYQPGSTLPDWWATDEEVQADSGIYNTSAGWDIDNGGEPNKYATYGLRYKFDKIPFTHQANGTNVSTKNTGIFRRVGSTKSGENTNLNFRANEVKVVDVHNLTLAELNRATNKATTPNGTRENTSTSSGFKDLEGRANGLFDMNDLTDEEQGCCYWLASPYASNKQDVCSVYYFLSYVDGSKDFYIGVRPVVTLSSVIQLVDENGDGVCEIQ